MTAQRARPLGRLTEADPKWFDHVLTFECPVHEDCRRVQVPTKPGSANGWDRSGESFETLTLAPSIKVLRPEECGWHGFVRNGRFETCGDSG